MNRPRSSKQCEVCKGQKANGCACGRYPKNTMFNLLASMGGKKKKLIVGDRIVNRGLPLPGGSMNVNAGKYGTVVGIDDDYAGIVYDDGGTGAGDIKNYDVVKGLPHASISNDSIDKANKELKQKVVYDILHNSLSPSASAAISKAIAGGAVSGSITVSTKTGKVKQILVNSDGHQTESKFKVGDRVKVVGNSFAGCSQLKGAMGTVRVIGEGLELGAVGVEFDRDFEDGHSLDGKIKSSRGRWGEGEELELYVKPVLKLNEQALDALVLSKDVKKEIVAVVKQHEHRDKLFDEWGLGSVIEYGKGMTMMFWGGPGTGKTWGAHCIAKALGQELLIISAAEVQSSEPGATERNIQDAFKSATEDNKVLFLDECDSLITTRSDLGLVLAAQVNCLLTEIEKFEGVCILATNRIETMDEALERRLALIVEFPFPKYSQRVEIWRKLLPKKLPLAEGVSSDVLAQPKFTGGQIKNIILQAARLAVAEDAKEVTQAHFDSAVVRINKSKGIMGKVERSRTGRPRGGMDVGVSVGVSNNPQVKTDVDIDTFLSTDEEEEERKR